MNRFPSIGVAPRAAAKCRAHSFGMMIMVGVLTTLLNVAGFAFGQSNIVFMAADVSPSFQSKLVRFDAGTETFAVTPSGDHVFHAVTVLNGEVLMADGRTANAIQRFSPNGTYLGVFASPPGSPGYLESDSSGNVYISLLEELPFPLMGYWRSLRFDSSGANKNVYQWRSWHRRRRGRQCVYRRQRPARQVCC